ncbi:stage III sporulation protein AC [Calorimonas adulescens]|jgi:stage III sporulation protein AC|uniref:Stage III sporulation protein AC n=1 Tax=Calorimonas adulescens TaxID=2606906 RepID=A0A5D8QGZ4_9THEO|nr:stage III sporulation protein AC [Calorimonas adulescens]TZE83454.1 stage III sporulation protein AC [Calorimonas adulescens]
MNVDIIFKIAAIGILVAVLNMVLVSSDRKEQAMMVTLVGLVVVLMMVITMVSNLFNAVKTMFQLY